MIVELSEKRRTAASSLGLGIKVVHPDQLRSEYEEAAKRGDDDWGFDVIVDCTGSPKAIEQQFLYTRRGNHSNVLIMREILISSSSKS